MCPSQKPRATIWFTSGRPTRALPQNWVSSIAQTPDGYLWVGTRYGGLARFDGVRFVSFNQQNTAELKDVQVEHLSVDKTGRLWVIMGNESVTAFSHGRFELFARRAASRASASTTCLKSDQPCRVRRRIALHRHAQFLRQQQWNVN